MDFSERLQLYFDGGMITHDDVEEILAIIEMFKSKYQMILEEENAAAFIAHLCAAFGRLKTDEDVEALPLEVKRELEGLATYSRSLGMLEDIMAVTHNRLNKTEQDYALLHINNLIAQSEGDRSN